MLLTVIDVPPDVLRVTDGDPAEMKLLPEMTTDVPPTGMLMVDAAVMVGIARTVPTTTAVPLDTPYMVTETEIV